MNQPEQKPEPLTPEQEDALVNEFIKSRPRFTTREAIVALGERMGMDGPRPHHVRLMNATLRRQGLGYRQVWRGPQRVSTYEWFPV